MKKPPVSFKFDAKAPSVSLAKLEIKSHSARRVLPSRERRKIDPRKVLGTNPQSKQKPKVASSSQKDIDWQTVPFVKTVYTECADDEERKDPATQNQSMAEQILQESIVESELAKELAIRNTRIKIFMAKIQDARVWTQNMIQKIIDLHELRDEIAQEYRLVVLQKNEGQLKRRKSLASKHDIIQRNAEEQKTSLERFKQSSLSIQTLKKALSELKEQVP